MHSHASVEHAMSRQEILPETVRLRFSAVARSILHREPPNYARITVSGLVRLLLKVAKGTARTVSPQRNYLHSKTPLREVPRTTTPPSRDGLSLARDERVNSARERSSSWLIRLPTGVGASSTKPLRTFTTCLFGLIHGGDEVRIYGEDTCG
eukprot:COSAG02_NODE_331_length_24480_cov_22.114720_15_plen_152_part_00